MINTIQQLDPVSGLYDYVLDVKPYHTKIVEVLVEYVHTEETQVIFNDLAVWDIKIDIPRVPLNTEVRCGGYSNRVFGDPYKLMISSPSPSSSFNVGFIVGAAGAGQIAIQGDVSRYFQAGSSFDLTTIIDDGVSSSPPPVGEDNSGTFTVQSVEFNPGMIDSWSDISDPSSYEVGDVPHTIITVNEPIVSFVDPSPSAYIGYVDLAQLVVEHYSPRGIILSGDYTGRFFPGVVVEGVGGDYVNGKRFTVLSVDCDGVNTSLRFLESVFTHGTGYPIAAAPTNQFVVYGDQTSYFPAGIELVAFGSYSNDNNYEVNGSNYNALLNTTTIDVTGTVVNEAGGELYPVNATGTIQEYLLGYSDDLDMCPVPESMVKVRFDEFFKILTISKMGESLWGFDLPSTSVIGYTEPVIALSEPASPSVNDLWFDSNVLKQWSGYQWDEEPTVFWIDLTTNQVLSRTKTMYHDTGWVIEYAQIPGFNNHVVVSDSNATVEWFFGSVENGVPVNTFELASQIYNSDPNYIEVQVNNTPATFSIISNNEISVTIPVIFEGDIIQVRLIEPTPTNPFLGDYGYPETPFNVPATITEGLSFGIEEDGTQAFRFMIQNMNAGTNTVTITGDATKIQNGQEVRIFDTSGPDGDYIVGSVPIYNGINTTFTVSSFSTSASQGWIEGYII